jgi:thiamine biosynthesis protein ThiS
MVNGEEREVADGATIEDLLGLLGINRINAVVERNEQVVERDRFAAVKLASGDRVEIVRFVGGG